MNVWKKPIVRGTGLVALALLTAACQTTATVGTDVACRAFGPIEWSRMDTIETVKQVRGHNAAYFSLCAQPG